MMTEANQFDLLIKNGNAILPDRIAQVDVGTRNEKIVAIEETLSGGAGRIVDATGCLLFPGFIDAHTHMGIPIKDTSSADDFNSGSTAAAFGGVTTSRVRANRSSSGRYREQWTDWRVIDDVDSASARSE